MGDETQNPWTVLESRSVYDNPWISVVEHKVLTPQGNSGIYGVVSPKNFALGVVPFTPEGKVILVGQYRFALGQYSWEIPEGGGSKALPPLESIARELKEETGYTARGWRELMRMHLSNSTCDELAISFLAWDLEPGEMAPEETEVLALRTVGFAKALDMVLTGEITDAITVASLLKVRILADRGELPPVLLPFVEA